MSVLGISSGGAKGCGDDGRSADLSGAGWNRDGRGVVERLSFSTCGTFLSELDREMDWCGYSSSLLTTSRGASPGRTMDDPGALGSSIWGFTWLRGALGTSGMMGADGFLGSDLDTSDIMLFWLVAG
jgi:hypothetical protein